MERQAKLDTGPLLGEARFNNVTDAELEAVQDDRVGSEEYITLGKRLVEFLYPTLSNFISILRTQYGQYWLRELEPWNSRKQSLGQYCSTTLGLKWRDENEKQWKPFRPTELQQHLTLRVPRGRGWAEYLTKDDWEQLASSFDPDRAPSLAAIILGKAYEFCDNEELRQAFVEGVTALELALNEFARRKQIDGPLSRQELGRVLKLQVREKFSATALMSDWVSKSAIEETLKAINIRNEIVHDGYTPEPSDEHVLRTLFQTITAFLHGDEYKFPVLIAGNRLEAPDQ
jgi:hypothetical protein